MDWSTIISHAQGVLLVLMIVIFIAITAWAYSPKSRQRMDDSANIPMRDEG